MLNRRITLNEEDWKFLQEIAGGGKAQRGIRMLIASERGRKYGDASFLHALRSLDTLSLSSVNVADQLKTLNTNLDAIKKHLRQHRLGSL
jgi:hypothetical protein